MNILRLVLLPFSLLYAVVVHLRNLAYDTGFFRSCQFKTPVISIGNLAVGGSGKSPMAEYLIRLLKDNHKVATLSRGYGRSTTGFIELSISTSAEEGGDEPVQFKRKFPDIRVAVCEDRVAGIKKLKHDSEIIILDDAYQHRAVKPGLSMLLFDHGSLSKWQLPLPAGNLREPFSARKRADILVVTKCSPDITPGEKEKLKGRLDPLPNQLVFFSTLVYGQLHSLDSQEKTPSLEVTADTEIYLLTGIANPQPLINHLEQYTRRISRHEYADHHRFTVKEIERLRDDFLSSPAQKKLIITTEKDAQRLRPVELAGTLKNLPVYYLPIRAAIIGGEEEFNRLITGFISRAEP